MKNVFTFFFFLVFSLTVAAVQNKSALDGSAGANNGTQAIAQQGTVQNIAVFPNPANEFLKVTWTGSGSSVQLKVFNILGKELFAVRAFSSNTAHLDLRDLPPGVYYVNFISAETQKVLRFRKE